jgi:hypothetical protein
VFIQQTFVDILRLIVVTPLASLLFLLPTGVNAQNTSQSKQLESRASNGPSVTAFQQPEFTKVVFSGGETFTYQELSRMQEKDKARLDLLFANLTNDRRRIEKRDFSDWLFAQENQKLKGLKETTAALQQGLVIKRRMLIEGYENYVSLAERKQLVPKQSQLDEIVEHKSTPAELRERARALRRGLE